MPVWVFGALLGALAIAVILFTRKRPSPGRGAAVAEGDAGTLHLEGDGDFAFDVVGEGNYQAALSQICGGKCEDGHELEVTAQLVPEPANPYDKNAVAVVIQGHKVAYFARDDAGQFQARMRRHGTGRAFSCDAMIVGGWKRDRRGEIDEGSFGVKLDL